ncbi:unnamed protein product, partial [Sphacelaria rigidula]
EPVRVPSFVSKPGGYTLPSAENFYLTLFCEVVPVPPSQHKLRQAVTTTAISVKLHPTTETPKPNDQKSIAPPFWLARRPGRSNDAYRSLVCRSSQRSDEHG